MILVDDFLILIFLGISYFMDIDLERFKQVSSYLRRHSRVGGLSSSSCMFSDLCFLRRIANLPF